MTGMLLTPKVFSGAVLDRGLRWRLTVDDVGLGPPITHLSFYPAAPEP